MAIEIERKFLVKHEGWRSQVDPGQLYRQGYLPTQAGTTVRIRTVGLQGYLTIKGSTSGISRAEYEYAIPLADAEAMLDTLCDSALIEKTRYRLTWGNVVWEIDEFLGTNQGLILAEVELKTENQRLELPDWVGQEVTDDSRYFNANLVRYPYCQWTMNAE